MPSNQVAALMECGCCGSLCCDGRACPGSGIEGALPSSLTIEVSASFAAPPVVTPPGSGFDPPANSDCFNFSFTLAGGCVQDLPIYVGIGEHSCTWCGTTYNVRLSVVLACGENGWFLTLEDLIPPGDCDLNVSGEQYSAQLAKDSCDPILMGGDINQCLDCGFTCQIGGIQIAPGVIVPVIATHSPFCLSFLVYETP